MQIGRRSLLKMLSAVPLAGKAAADKAVADLTGASLSGLGGWSNNAPQAQPAGVTENPTPQQYARAFRNPLMRRQVESLLYRTDCRNVYALDPDLAALKSFSMAAKITFQRQRNVERQIEAMQDEWPWQKLAKLASGALGLLGGV